MVWHLLRRCVLLRRLTAPNASNGSSCFAQLAGPPLRAASASAIAATAAAHHGPRAHRAEAVDGHGGGGDGGGGAVGSSNCGGADRAGWGCVSVPRRAMFYSSLSMLSTTASSHSSGHVRARSAGSNGHSGHSGRSNGSRVRREFVGGNGFARSHVLVRLGPSAGNDKAKELITEIFHNASTSTAGRATKAGTGADAASSGGKAAVAHQRLVRRLRHALPVFADLIRRFHECDIARLLDVHCPLPVVGGGHGNGSDSVDGGDGGGGDDDHGANSDGFQFYGPGSVDGIDEDDNDHEDTRMAALTNNSMRGASESINAAEVASSHEAVSRFVKAVCVRIVPVEFWGSAHNANLFLSRLDLFVRLRKLETCTVEQLARGFKVTEMGWAYKVLQPEQQQGKRKRKLSRSHMQHQPPRDDVDDAGVDDSGGGSVHDMSCQIGSRSCGHRGGHRRPHRRRCSRRAPSDDQRAIELVSKLLGWLFGPSG